MLKYVKIVKVAKIAVITKLTTLAYVGTIVIGKSLVLTSEPVTELSPFVMSYLSNVYDLCKWNFLNIFNNIGTVALFIDVHDAIDVLNSEYEKTGKLRFVKKNLVWKCSAMQFGHQGNV